ncbi:class I SAM-dependent methyltransferase [Gordonia otitidis]|nr:class I SAM-dependent methyltransferase [Gordonia otitidis]
MTDHSALRTSYSALSAEYVDAFGSIEHTHPADRSLVAAWAGGLIGTVLDAGCGPGQWSRFLARQGCDVQGVDLVPEFVDYARSTYPGLTFDVGDFSDIDVETGSLGGILAWYTTIHHEPEELPGVLAEFARVLRPGGGLLVGYFESEHVEAFEHRVTRAYRWPTDALSDLIRAAGFVIVETHSRKEFDARPHGAIVARRIESR